MNGFFTTALQILLQSSLLAFFLLLVGRLIQPFLKRSDPRQSYLLWLATILCAGSLPIAVAILPAWTFEIEGVGAPFQQVLHTAPVNPSIATTVATDHIPSTSYQSDPSSVSSRTSWTTVLSVGATVIWVAGFLWHTTGLFFGFRRNHQHWKSSRPLVAAQMVGLLETYRKALGIRRRIQLAETNSKSMPMTFGVLFPKILLPQDWRKWSPEQIRVVLGHELSHIKRFDALAQMVATVTCALYWFLPLAGWAKRQLEETCEMACDEIALRQGGDRGTYASILVDLAYLYQTPRHSFPLLNLAPTSNLEERVVAILEERKSRPAFKLVVLMLGTMGLVLPLSAIQVHAVASKQYKVIFGLNEPAKLKGMPDETWPRINVQKKWSAMLNRETYLLTVSMPTPDPSASKRIIFSIPKGSSFKGMLRMKGTNELEFPVSFLQTNLPVKIILPKKAGSILLTEVSDGIKPTGSLAYERISVPSGTSKKVSSKTLLNPRFEEGMRHWKVSGKVHYDPVRKGIAFSEQPGQPAMLEQTVYLEPGSYTLYKDVQAGSAVAVEPNYLQLDLLDEDGFLVVGMGGYGKSSTDLRITEVGEYTFRVKGHSQLPVEFIPIALRFTSRF